MQPPQLRNDSVAAYSTKHWLKSALWVAVLLLVVATDIALLQFKEQVQGRMPSPATAARSRLATAIPCAE